MAEMNSVKDGTVRYHGTADFYCDESDDGLDGLTWRTDDYREVADILVSDTGALRYLKTLVLDEPAPTRRMRR